MSSQFRSPRDPRCVSGDLKYSSRACQQHDDAGTLASRSEASGVILGVRIIFATVMLALVLAAPARAQAPEPYFAKSYALLIGNDAYGNGWPHLQNGVKDAEEMAKELARHGFHTVVKRNLGRRELIDALETFFIETGSDPDARLVVWFSGHGHTVNGEGYLVPSGAPGPDNDVRFRQGAVSVRAFGRLMREAKSRHVLAILDSCFSGTVFASVRGAEGTLPPPVANVIGLPVRQMISSGKAGEVVSDNGRFRQLVIEALSQRRPAADPNGDGYVLGSNLGQFLFEQVSEETGGRQNPQYGKLDNTRFNQGDFVFRTLPLSVALTPSDPPQAPPVDTRPKTYVDQLLENLSREISRLHEIVGTPVAIGSAVMLAFYWRWRTNIRLLKQLRPGTAGLSEELAVAVRMYMKTTSYRQALQEWLGWLSWRLGSERLFSSESYDRMLRLAVMYPCGAWLFSWFLPGTSQPLFANSLPQITPEIGGAGLGLLIGLAHLLIRLGSPAKPSQTIALPAFIIVYIFVYHVAARAHDSGTSSLSAISVIFILASLIGMTAEGMRPEAVVSWALVIAVLSMTNPSNVHLLAPAWLVPAAFAYNWFGINQSGGKIAGASLWAILISAIILSPSMEPSLLGARPLATFILVAFGLIPLINAPFDWLSLNTTRLYLSRTASGGPAIRNALIDAVLAIVFLFGLSIALVAGLQALNIVAIAGGGQEPIIDLYPTIDALRNKPADPGLWWIYMMLASTLLPSLIHLFIAIMSVATFSLPRPIMRSHIAALESGFEGHPQALARTALTMTIREFLSWGAFALALAAIIGVGFGLTNIVPWIGLAILWVAEWTAYWLNAPITPGPPPWA